MSNLVSIIIPTYNYGHYLHDCLKSALSQTHQNIEVIVVDDGSTDDTSNVAELKDARVRYIFQENQGLSAARNTGLNASTGAYIQLLDSDDMLHPRAVEHKLTTLKSTTGCHWVVGQNYHFEKQPRFLLPRFLRPRWGLHSLFLDEKLFEFNIAPPHSFLFTRQFLDTVGRFDTKLKACEDYDYWLRGLAAGFYPIYCSKSLSYYRQHPNSMSKMLKKQTFYDALMHPKARSIIEKSNYREPNESNLIVRVHAAIGLVKTMTALRTLGIKGDDQLAPIQKKYRREIIDMLTVLAPEQVSFRTICLIHRLNSSISSYQSLRGTLTSNAQESISIGTSAKPSWLKLYLEFLKLVLFNSKANLKTRVDYSRWMHGFLFNLPSS